MQQVLFWIPIKTGLTPNGIPLYGFGTMLFLSFVVGMWLAGRRADREGVSRDRLFDLALPVFLCGIVGARIVYMVQYHRPWQEFLKFWEGGIVFYGSAVGGWVGYMLAWWFSFRKYHISTWKLADIAAPAVCLGLAVGRLGCFLNGCCYGHVCTESDQFCPRYPVLTAPARELVVGQGYQTAAGFGLDPAAVAAAQGQGPPVVGPIEPGSEAARAGLQRGDMIISANDVGIGSVDQLERFFFNWPRGETRLALSVVRDGKETKLPAFKPRTLPLHPTQVYESISMFLLLLVLLAFCPYRRHYGQVFVLLMLGYAVHRFFNETLRNDTEPVLLSLTLSQVGSIAVFAAGLGLEAYLRAFTPKLAAAPAPLPAPSQASA